MKRFYLTSLFFTVVFTIVSFAQNPVDINAPASKVVQIEQNYLKGLNSDIPGLQVSCAYFLGEMKSQKAVPELIDMLKNAKNPGAKIIAAWSLAKIGDPRGLKLLKTEGKKSECEYSNCFCAYLYMDYCLKKYGRKEE